MDIQIINSKIRCDIGCCKNVASYSIGGQGVLPRRRLNICGDCAKELYGLLGGILVPKSPDNHIKSARTRQTAAKALLVNKGE